MYDSFWLRPITRAGLAALEKRELERSKIDIWDCGCLEEGFQALTQAIRLFPEVTQNPLIAL